MVLCKYYNYSCFLLLFLFAVSIKYAYSETENSAGTSLLLVREITQNTEKVC